MQVLFINIIVRTFGTCRASHATKEYFQFWPHDLPGKISNVQTIVATG